MKALAGDPSTLRTSYRTEIALLNTSLARFWTVVAVLLFLLAPFVMSSFWLGVANQTLIAAIGALALNLLMGVTGQISLGHAGFIAAGAFTGAALVTHFEAPFLINLLAALAVGGLLGVLVGLPALRLKGLYLAVSTLAAHFVIIVAIGQYQASIGYGAGFSMPSPSVLGLPLGDERSWFFFLWPVSLLVLLFHVNLLRSSYGRAWLAIHHRDVSAQAFGINTAAYKLLAFSTSTAITCFSGVLWAYHTGFVSVEAFDFHMLIQYLAMVIIGGLGSILGSVLGACFVMILPHGITHLAESVPLLQGLGGMLFEVQIGVFGAVMLAFILLEPRGLAGLWLRLRDYFQLWPFKYRSWEQ